MPMLRPAQRTSLDLMTGELVHWQAEGWLEAQHADQLLREQRATRRDDVGVLVADLAARAVAPPSVASPAASSWSRRRLSRRRLRG